MVGVLMFICETLISWLYNCISSYCFQQVPQVKSISFLATATDKTNNPTYCYTFTPTGVAQETSYADYVGVIKKREIFYIFFSIFNGKSIYKS
jgi:hypothetical protein